MGIRRVSSHFQSNFFNTNFENSSNKKFRSAQAVVIDDLQKAIPSPTHMYRLAFSFEISFIDEI